MFLAIAFCESVASARLRPEIVGGVQSSCPRPSRPARLPLPVLLLLPMLGACRPADDATAHSTSSAGAVADSTASAAHDAAQPTTPRRTDARPRSTPAIEANLLFISIDTLRADHLGCYGYDRATSPNIDVFAADSHRFAHAYTVMPSTLPSHTAMMTSRYPWEVGVQQNGCKIAKAADMLAERLARRGFATRAVVSAAPLHSETQFDQGFAEFYEGAWRAETTRGHAGDLLRQVAGERFFLFVHFFDPHTPYEAPPEYADMFGAPHEPQPPSKYQMTREMCAAGIDAYDAEIRYTDAMVGDLLRDLDGLGLRDRTIVVLVSDHGETLDESFERANYAFFHGQTLYRRELHIPMILSAPAAVLDARPAVHELDVSTLDLLPTLLELLGAPPEGVIRGRSLVPLMRGESMPARDVFSALRTACGGDVFRGGAGSVVSERWHWICNERGETSLFDQWSDPAERISLRKTHRDVAKRMRTALTAFQRRSREWETDPTRAERVGREALERLRALGYTGDDEPEQP